MKLGTLGAWISFGVQIASGTAVAVWPQHRDLAVAIFLASTAAVFVSIGWWLHVHFQVRNTWPFIRRKVVRDEVALARDWLRLANDIIAFVADIDRARAGRMDAPLHVRVLSRDEQQRIWELMGDHEDAQSNNARAECQRRFHVRVETAAADLIERGLITRRDIPRHLVNQMMILEVAGVIGAAARRHARTHGVDLGD